MEESFDIASAAGSFLTREKLRADKRRALHARAVADCARIIDMAVDVFHPLRVLQWGSLLEPEIFDESSDIDIAVEGLAGARQFLDFIGRALDMTDFPLDIVELEKLDPGSREALMRRARVVYERR
jgi:predicted nucleotidyltransferase